MADFYLNLTGSQLQDKLDKIDTNEARIDNLDGDITIGTGTITTTGWVTSATNYEFELSVPIVGIDSSRLVDVYIDVNSQTVASEAELSPSVTEYTSGLKFYANTPPSINIPFKWKAVR